MEEKKKSPPPREQLKSSRSLLRRSVSAGAVPRVSSAVALWGEEGAKEFEEEDRTLERILRENKARRAPREELIELRGKEWRIEGFHKGANIYHDEGTMSQGVTVLRCDSTIINLPRKCAHVMLNDLRDCKVRIKGVISQVEMVHCNGVEVVLQGPVPVLQIDLCRNIVIILQKAALDTRPKIVNASNTNIQIIEGNDSNAKQDITTSMFGEQFVSYWVKENGVFVLHSKTTDELKSGGSGYVEIAGVSGSTHSLLDLEDKQRHISK